MPSIDIDPRRIRDVAVRLCEAHQLAGIAVGVVSGGELVFAEGFGHADIESGRPQDPNLRQRIGSITKTMVALCTLALVEERRLSLDDRVVERLPDLKLDGAAEELRVRHLLTHTGGIGETPRVDQILDPGAALWSDDPHVGSVLEQYADGVTLEIRPGTRFAYANHGFAILGEILAREEGVPIADVLRQRVFEPLGMENTDALDRPHPDLTTPYHRAPTEDERQLRRRAGAPVPEPEEPVDGINIRGRYQHLKAMAAGAAQSTIPDMARYAAALLDRGGGLVRPETFDAMTTPQWCPDPRLTHMGFAFFLEERLGRPSFGHGGGIVGGWGTHLSVFPREKLALLTHQNQGYAKSMEVDTLILAEILGAPPPRARDLALDPDVLARAPGVYECPSPGPLTNLRVLTGTGRLQISACEGELVLTSRRGPWKSGVRMRPADPRDTGFFALESDEPEPAHVALVRDPDGRVTGLRCNRMVEMLRNPELAPWA